MSDEASVPSCRRKLAAAAAAAALVAGLTSATASPAGAVRASEAPVEWMEATYVAAVNYERERAGLPHVALDVRLRDWSRQWAAELARVSTLAHDPLLPVGTRSIAPGASWAAENVGVGTTVEEVHAMFMGSAAHRSNILARASHVGVGVAVDRAGRIWVTQRLYR